MWKVLDIISAHHRIIQTILFWIYLVLRYPSTTIQLHYVRIELHTKLIKPTENYVAHVVIQFICCCFYHCIARPPIFCIDLIATIASE